MSGGRQPSRAAIESQLDAEAGTMTGPLLAECLGEPGAEVTLRWTPGRRVHDAHMAGGLCDCAEEPAVTWTVGKRTGPLSAMSFVGAWNSAAPEVAGHPVACEMEEGEGLELPFVAWHPSGTFQAVRYDGAAGCFVRRVLYPVSWPEVSEVVATHVAGGQGGG